MLFQGELSNKYSPLENLLDCDVSATAAVTLDHDPWAAPSVHSSPHAAVDIQNPWEMAIHQEKEKKRKGKHQENVVSKEEPRNSLRVKLNQMVGAKEVKEVPGGPVKSTGKAKTGTNFLIDQFPYSFLSDLDLVKLYDVSGFKLGDTLEDSITIVQSIRSLSKPKLVSVINNTLGTGFISSSDINGIVHEDCDLDGIVHEGNISLHG